MTYYQVVYLYLDENGKEEGRDVEAIFKTRKEAQQLVKENTGLFNLGLLITGEKKDYDYIIEEIDESKLDDITKAIYLEGKRPVYRKDNEGKVYINIE